METQTPQQSTHQQTPKSNINEKDEHLSFDEYYNQLQKNTSLGPELVKHQGFWCWTHLLRPIISFQTHFQAQPTDLYVTSMAKTGTTWLKSLLFATVDRHRNHLSNSPLLHRNPHNLVLTLEMSLYRESPRPDLSNVFKGNQGLPRLLGTHLPYESLPKSIQDLECKILYISRNPLDTFVSSWFFTKSLVDKNHPGCQFPTMEEYFELYLQGLTSFGPFFEHVLGYWKKSVEMPHKVLFVKYEDLLENTTSQLKRIAEFVGQPFSLEEEQDGMLEEIVKLCSINNLKNLTVNQEGQYQYWKNNMFFRNGKAGDWTNYLTPAMAERMHELMQQKFHGSGLSIEQMF